MALSSGHRLGPYEIVEPLGAGGMGEVYRARDTRLDREVAIKVLPSETAADEDALARFEREAKAVAALSHPNILALHDVDTGRDGGSAYAVTELLEGQTLGEALAEGALPPRRGIEIASEIARGLGAAHDGGVVHRDIKPDNLFLLPDGRVKILDFGLATLTGAAAAAGAQAATRTSLTQPGTVMGTVHYMSPEQARGENAGAASDIFSLGSVLYEMLTGRRPFEQETVPETMTAILREDPPEIDRDGVSLSVIRIVQRCMEKEPGQRFQSAHDLAFALEGTSNTSATGAVAAAVDAPRSGRRSGRLMPALLALVAGIAIGAIGASWLRPASVPPPVKIRPITFSGLDGSPTVSPDGRTIAFGSERGEEPGLWIKHLDRGDAARLTRGRDFAPKFSPDGTTLLFTRAESGVPSIYRVSTVGGVPRKLTNDATGGHWSPDGSRFVFVRGGVRSLPQIGIANIDGSGERIVAEGETGDFWRSPRWSPDGARVAFVERRDTNNVALSVMLLDLDDGALRELPPKRPSVSNLAWSGSGHELIFAWSEDLLAGAASNESRVVLQDVRSGATRDLFWTRNMLNRQSGTGLEVAAPGVVVFGTLALRQNLMWTEPGAAGPAISTPLTSGNSSDRQPRLAPDGETILFSSNRTGNLDLWTINRRTGATRQLTDDAARDWDPGFTRGGSEILWSSDRSGNLEIWIANADGSGARQVTSDGVSAENPSATPDGEWIVYITANPAHPGLWKIRRDGSDATRLWEGAGFIPELSPDGRTVALVTEPGNPVIRFVEIDSGELLPLRIEVPQPGDWRHPFSLGRPRWTDDGRSIAFIGASGNEVGIYKQAFVPDGDTTATRREVAGFDEEWATESYDVSPDGRIAIISRFRPGGTVMLAENVPFITRPARP